MYVCVVGGLGELDQCICVVGSMGETDAYTYLCMLLVAWVN